VREWRDGDLVESMEELLGLGLRALGVDVDAGSGELGLLLLGGIVVSVIQVTESFCSKVERRCECGKVSIRAM